MSGRNLDYGHQKSDSREGSMAKKSLLTMAKDLHNLYCALHDEDDLPQWCHYKIAKSQNELEAVTNYLTSKIAKSCVDQGIDKEELHLIVNESLLRGVIKEGLFDSLKGLFGKGDRTKKVSSSLMRDAESLKKIIYANKETYKHLYLFYRMVYLLKESNKVFSLFSQIPATTITKINDDLEDYSSRRDMLSTEISKSIMTIVISIRNLRFILNKVKHELYYDINPRKIKSARIKEATSLEKSGKILHSYNQINQLANVMYVDMQALERFDMRGLTLQIANQIKSLCGNDKDQIKTLIDFIERIIDSVENYTKMFNLVQKQNEFEKIKLKKRKSPQIGDHTIDANMEDYSYDI